MRRLVTGLALLVVVIAVPGGERDGRGGTTRLSLCTGNTTGVYYILGGGLAQRISRHLPGYRATAEPTSASVENLHRVARGDCDIAFTLADSAVDAVRAGEPIAALARLYPNYTQVLVRRSTGVQRIADLRAKRISMGSPNSGTEVIALRLLEAAGLDPGRDVRAQALSLPESVQGLKDGVLDALFWSGGLSTPGIRDLLTSLKGRVGFVPLDDLTPVLRRDHGPIYVDAEIPADTANGQRRPTKTIAVPNLLVVNSGLSERLAHDLTRLLFERRDELGDNVHPAAKRIPPPKEQGTDPVPLHPGAERYFREVGR
ncbi:MAG TPA: TAXI family TRAP transporter solute-binding subunit [Acidimicrobiia bacterium]|nr:TAXI family TRAP transporter solute-binding subunit [Acidimicrobiia bacterium]